MGCQSEGCRLFYRTAMPTACNLQSRRDLRSVKEPMDMRVGHPIGMRLLKSGNKIKYWCPLKIEKKSISA